MVLDKIRRLLKKTGGEEKEAKSPLPLLKERSLDSGSRKAEGIRLASEISITPDFESAIPGKKDKK